VAAVVLVLLLCGCSDDGEARPDGPPTPDGTSGLNSPSASPAVRASERLLGEGTPEDEPLASAQGQLPMIGDSSPVRVDVLEVRAGEESTLLRWRLASATTEPVATYTSALSFPLGFDTRQVALLSDDQRLQPFTFVPQVDITGNDADCVCSRMPEQVGPDGTPMTALYPPLSEGTEQVDVVLPGIATLLGVPVTR